MSAPIIHLQGISKNYESKKILDNIDLTIYDGEFITLLGPSGCGKTTLIQLISGFSQPDAGKIIMAGQDISGLPPQQRDVNTVFQHYALFPHMSVYENIAFGLQCKNFPQNIIEQRVTELLHKVRLTEYADCKPDELSGGQQQRVAIARAAVNEPLMLLLDEPFSALDYHLRKSMQLELKQLQRNLKMTFIFVTHDQEEALSMSDRIAVLNQGKIAQIGTPREIYENPTSLAVAQFIGDLNRFDCKIKAIAGKNMQLEIEDINLTLPNTHNYQVNDAIHLLVRPEDLRVWKSKEIENTDNMLPATVESIIYKGSTVDLVLQLASGKHLSATEFFDEDDEELEYKIGQAVWIHWLPGWEVILTDES